MRHHRRRGTNGAQAPRSRMSLAAHGKLFLLDGAPFRFRGIAYRTLPELSETPDSPVLDLEAIARAGYTVVVMPSPSRAPIPQMSTSDLRFMLELDVEGLDGLGSVPRAERRRVLCRERSRLRQAVRSWKGHESLIGVVLSAGPRGRKASGSSLSSLQIANQLAMALHDEGAELLAGWRSRWPLIGDCPAECDFLIVDLEPMTPELESTLMNCHSRIGDRPLVVGTVCMGTPERRESERIPRVIDAALHAGAAGTVEPAPLSGKEIADELAMARHRRRTVRDLEVDWPSISVVVNAYNAEETLDECLSRCDQLEYPSLEVIVVDDGSTDATATIAGAHPDVRVVSLPRSGLSVARNVGYRAAGGELIAYLDADAYPSPDWPWYLALAALEHAVGGSGGPNIPPPGEPASARIVARSPGGPVPQLRSPDRAHHLPGCNMAFWKDVLEQLDGFDPVLEGAEDIDFEWRVFASGRQLAYHPAALVWHHRRAGLAGYLRQQRHYGRSQAILEQRYPQRFPPGYRFRKAAARIRGRSDEDAQCAVKYLTLPRPDPAPLALAHQWGVPAALALCLTGPFALVRRRLAVPAVGGTAFLGALFVIDAVRAGTARRSSERTLGFRVGVAAFRLLRPLAFRWGHLRGRRELRRVAPEWPRCPGSAIPPASRPAECSG
jgi:GT2 family glycosyltransferase